MNETQVQLLAVTTAGHPSSADPAPVAVARPAFLTTRLGLLVVIPGLVIAAAGGAVVLGQTILGSALAEHADREFQLRAADIQDRTGRILNQAGATVEGLHDWLIASPSTAMSAPDPRHLIAITQSQPAISQAYIAGSDGSLRGILRSEDGGWRVLAVVPLGDGAMERTVSTIARDGTLTAISREPKVAYDARTRPWYRAAIGTTGRVWTDPYLFARSNTPGITCAQALEADDPAHPVRAVVAVDLDLASLGNAIDSPGDPAQHTVFTADRLLVAAPRRWLADLAPGVMGKAEALRAPEALAFFAALPARELKRIASFPFAVAGEGHRGQVLPVQAPGGPTWYVGQLVSNRQVMGAVDAVRQQALLLAAAAVGLGVAIAVFLARQIAVVRAEAKAQRTRAVAAEAKVRELGSYRLVSKLGEGGMGQVWLAEHRLLARPAAVKVILPGSLLSAADLPQIRARFELEARITASLRCRNTVELYDYGVSPGGEFYYVMELLDGFDLRKLVERHGPVHPGRARHLLLQVLASLAEAHDRGLVHRDIKPENIHTCRRADELDVVKVLDFGLVRVRRTDGSRVQLTQDGFVQGTPATMSPEQIQDLDLDGRSDLYSLGCVACWLLTGQEVFPVGSGATMSLLHQHLSEGPVSVGNRGRSLPADLVAAIDRCLAKKPAERWSDARALATALQVVTLSDDERWTPAQARAWWDLHKPAAPSSAIIAAVEPAHA